MFIVVFRVIAHKWLGTARKCLDIREAYLREEQKLLFEEPFNPLRDCRRHLTPEDQNLHSIDKHIRIPFWITVTAAVVISLFFVY